MAFRFTSLVLAEPLGTQGKPAQPPGEGDIEGLETFGRRNGRPRAPIQLNCLSKGPSPIFCVIPIFDRSSIGVWRLFANNIRYNYRPSPRCP